MGKRIREEKRDVSVPSSARGCQNVHWHILIPCQGQAKFAGLWSDKQNKVTANNIVRPRLAFHTEHHAYWCLWSLTQISENYKSHNHLSFRWTEGWVCPHRAPPRWGSGCAGTVLSVLSTWWRENLTLVFLMVPNNWMNSCPKTL